jgi:hypothetical protein
VFDLTTFYHSGKRDAFRKYAGLDAGDMVDLLGGVSPAGAAIGAGFTAPDGYGLGHAARTGVASAAGQHFGKPTGELVGSLIAKLLKQNPETGSLIGGALGRSIGGSRGAHVGRMWADDSMMKDMQKKQMGGG